VLPGSPLAVLPGSPLAWAAGPLGPRRHGCRVRVVWRRRGQLKVTWRRRLRPQSWCPRRS